ncbi:type III-B CRISPR module-associated protein Cmr3 [Myxococcota bacterium]|nr:type III-B CRISPR module-associated protein Cmr3 [Myxococcota bacterium]
MSEIKQWWILEPQSVVVLRDGRPFASAPGSKAYSLSFPYPSTLAGAARTHLGSSPTHGGFCVEGTGYTNESAMAEALLREVSSRGPFLVRLSETGKIEEWYLPSPLDAVCFERGPKDDSGKVNCVSLVPQGLGTGEQSNLPGGWVPLMLSSPQKGKPASTAPAFWKWSHLQRWLLQPTTQTIDPKALGIGQLESEWRTHVSVQEDSSTAEEGALFQVQGIRFLAKTESAKEGQASGERTSGKNRFGDLQRMGIATHLQAPQVWEKRLKEGFGYLGGERRAGMWRKQEGVESAFKMSQELEEAIVQAGAARLLLATPAYFTRGTLPTWLLEPKEGVTPRLCALRTERPQVVSGWDLQYKTAQAKRQGAPKPTRRLMTAGSVLYLKLEGEASAIRRWLHQHWCQPISDLEQDRRDGFGIALFGTTQIP